MAPDPGITLDAVFAIAAAGEDPNSWESGGNSPLDFLETRAITYTHSLPPGGALDPSKVGKLICGIVAGNGDPTNFAEHDWVSYLDDLYDPDTGAFGDYGLVKNSYWALLSQAALRPPAFVSIKGAQWLKDQQQPNGGWWTQDGGASWDDVNTNDTAVVVQALTSSGEPGTAAPVTDAIGYLQTQQQPDGGFPFADPSAFGEPVSGPINDGLALSGFLRGGGGTHECPLADAFDLDE